MLLAQFGEIHPSIISKLDYKEKNIYGFEIFLDNIPKPNKKLRVLKENFKFSDFQISEKPSKPSIFTDVNKQGTAGTLQTTFGLRVDFIYTLRGISFVLHSPNRQMSGQQGHII